MPSDAAPLEPLEEVYRALVVGVRDYVAKNGFTQVVIGLSGGIDSALTAVVAVDALGASNVLGLFMPSPYTSRESREDVAEVVTEMLQSLEGDLSEVNLKVYAELEGLAKYILAAKREIAALRASLPRPFVIVAPGVRPAAGQPHDQARTATPAATLLAGADYLVIGRPITGAPDPAEAARRIAGELA